MNNLEYSYVIDIINNTLITTQILVITDIIQYIIVNIIKYNY